MTRGAALLRIASLATAIAIVFAFVASSGSLSSDRVRDAIDPLGLAAVPAFILVSALLTCALFPGPLLAGASGLLFGTALGTPVAITAATLGAVLAFGVARFAAHDAVEQLAGRRLAPLQEWIERRGFWAVLYARIAPGVPYSLVNYAAGLTRVSLPAFADRRRAARVRIHGARRLPGRPRLAGGDHRLRGARRHGADRRRAAARRARPRARYSCWT